MFNLIDLKNKYTKLKENRVYSILGTLDIETRDKIKEMNGNFGFGFAISDDNKRLAVVFDNN